MNDDKNQIYDQPFNHCVRPYINIDKVDLDLDYSLKDYN